MSFHLDIRSAATRAAEARADRLGAIKAECRRRIHAVASAECQMNIIGARAAGMLPKPQADALAQALDWIAAMRARVAALAEAGGDYTADAAWPPCPDAVRALADRF